MSVVVGGNAPESIIDPVSVRKQAIGSVRKTLMQHDPNLFRGVRVVSFPDHHRHEAGLALGDPAEVVLVIPLGEARRLAEFAVR